MWRSKYKGMIKRATLKATIDKNISFDEGKRYVFTLEVKNNESSLLMTVLVGRRQSSLQMRM